MPSRTAPGTRPQGGAAGLKAVRATRRASHAGAAAARRSDAPARRVGRAVAAARSGWRARRRRGPRWNAGGDVDRHRATRRDRADRTDGARSRARTARRRARRPSPSPLVSTSIHFRPGPFDAGGVDAGAIALDPGRIGDRIDRAAVARRVRAPQRQRGARHRPGDPAQVEREVRDPERRRGRRRGGPRGRGPTSRSVPASM